MNKVKVAAVVLVACLPLMSWAAESVSEFVVEVEYYSYGQALDVKEVISIKSLQPEALCGVVEKEMLYKDAQGQQHELVYKAVSNGIGCSNG